jgi:hypothetical protein
MPNPYLYISGSITMTLDGNSDGWIETWGLSTPSIEEAVATDQHEILLIGGTAAVDIAKQKIERLFYEARTWQTAGVGLRVYVYYSMDGINSWRGELIDGTLQSHDAAMKYERAVGTQQLTLTLTRKNWLEGTEAQVALTNQNGSNNTSGLNVYNYNDLTGSSPTKKCNYFMIPHDVIAGDIPARCRLEVTGPTFGSDAPGWMLITCARWRETVHDAYLDSPQLMHWSEAPQPGGMGGGATTTSDATRTNGDYKNLAAPSTTTMVEDSPAPSGVNVFQSMVRSFSDTGYYRILAGMMTDATPVNAKLQGYLNSDAYGMPIYDTITNNWKLFDLGLIKYPGLYNNQNYGNLYGYSVNMGATSTVVHADWLEVMRQDAAREFWNFGMPSTSYVLVDDGIDAQGVYMKYSGYTYSSVASVGNFIELVPNRLHYFYLNATNASKRHYLFNPFSVKLFYRPRRLSI